MFSRCLYFRNFKNSNTLIIKQNILKNFKVNNQILMNSTLNLKVFNRNSFSTNLNLNLNENENEKQKEINQEINQEINNNNIEKKEKKYINISTFENLILAMQLSKIRPEEQKIMIAHQSFNQFRLELAKYFYSLAKNELKDKAKITLKEIHEESLKLSPEINDEEFKNHILKFVAANMVKNMPEFLPHETFENNFLNIFEQGLPNLPGKKGKIKPVKKQFPVLIPPQPDGLTIELFLKRIKKDCIDYKDKFSSWEDLMTARSRELKARGIPIKNRKWILSWVYYFKRQIYCDYKGYPRYTGKKKFDKKK
eukprot:TRINITY_DN1514_c1_g1_i1.p1 TRINITY_DN1514_c1_g1~~TRINITY_DN1514_c1_g1_i1.p1  ORF type:complete len:310 (+),score=124.56 TRINITY_DN1514_c1_g1_i1:43-972(+)